MCQNVPDSDLQSVVHAFTCISVILKYVWWRAGILHFPEACRLYPRCKILDYPFKEQELKMSVPMVERKTCRESDSLAPDTDNSCLHALGFRDYFYSGPQWQSTCVGQMALTMWLRSDVL